MKFNLVNDQEQVAQFVRRGMAWPGVAWRGLAWPGVAWRGLAWPGVALCYMALALGFISIVGGGGCLQH